MGKYRVSVDWYREFIGCENNIRKYRACVNGNLLESDSFFCLAESIARLEGFGLKDVENVSTQLNDSFVHDDMRYRFSDAHIIDEQIGKWRQSYMFTELVGIKEKLEGDLYFFKEILRGIISRRTHNARVE